MKWFAVFAIALLSIHSTVLAKEPGKEVQQPRRLQAKIGVLRDGGSAIINIPAHGDKPACTIYVDQRLNTKTRGEIFLENDFHHPDQQGKPLSWERANDLLKQLEEVLLAHYGPAKLLELVLNPIEPGAHLSEDEFGERMLKDPEFNDCLDARYLMTEIIAYRTHHGPVAKKK